MKRALFAGLLISMSPLVVIAPASAESIDHAGEATVTVEADPSKGPVPAAVEPATETVSPEPAPEPTTPANEPTADVETPEPPIVPLSVNRTVYLNAAELTDWDWLELPVDEWVAEAYPDATVELGTPMIDRGRGFTVGLYGEVGDEVWLNGDLDRFSESDRDPEVTDVRVPFETAAGETGEVLVRVIELVQEGVNGGPTPMYDRVDAKDVEIDVTDVKVGDTITTRIPSAFCTDEAARFDAWSRLAIPGSTKHVFDGEWRPWLDLKPDELPFDPENGSPTVGTFTVSDDGRSLTYTARKIPAEGFETVSLDRSGWFNGFYVVCPSIYVNYDFADPIDPVGDASVPDSPTGEPAPPDVESAEPSAGTAPPDVESVEPSAGTALETAETAVPSTAAIRTETDLADVVPAASRVPVGDEPAYGLLALAVLAGVGVLVRGARPTG